MATIKNITMRLYRQHDLDLLYLYKLPGFSLQIAVKKAIDAFVGNKNYVIDYPEWPQNTELKINKKNAQIHILLDEERDEQAIDWIDSVSPGYRNSLLKNLIRQYLNRAVTEIYTLIEPAAAEKAKKMQPRNKQDAKHISAKRGIEKQPKIRDIDKTQDIQKDGKNTQSDSEQNNYSAKDTKKRQTIADEVLGTNQNERKNTNEQSRAQISASSEDSGEDVFGLFDKLMGEI